MFSAFTTITGCFRLWTILFEYWIFWLWRMWHLLCFMYMVCQSDPQRSRQLRMTGRLGVWGHWWPLILWRDCLILLHFAWHLSITKMHTVGVIYSRLYKSMSLVYYLHLCFLWVFFGWILSVYIFRLLVFCHLHYLPVRISSLSN